MHWCTVESKQPVLSHLHFEKPELNGGSYLASFWFWWYLWYYISNPRECLPGLPLGLSQAVCTAAMLGTSMNQLSHKEELSRNVFSGLHQTVPQVAICSRGFLLPWCSCNPWLSTSIRWTVGDTHQFRVNSSCQMLDPSALWCLSLLLSVGDRPSLVM